MDLAATVKMVKLHIVLSMINLLRYREKNHSNQIFLYQILFIKVTFLRSDSVG